MPGGPEFRADPESSSSASCEALSHDLAAYVWGALEPDERARVETHRTHCSACDRWLRESEQALSRVDLAVPRTSPPPELRSRVLASIDWAPPAVASVRPTRSAVAETPTERWPTVTATSTPAHTGSARRGAPRRGSPFLAGLATGLAGAVAAAVFAIVLIVRPEALNGLAPPRSELGSSESRPGVPPPIFEPGGVAASGGRLLQLRSPATPGHGLLVYDADTHRGVLLLQDMASPDGTEYTVWLVQGSQRTKLGTTVTDARGVGTYVLPEPLPMDHPDRIEVGPSSGAGPVLSASF